MILKKGTLIQESVIGYYNFFYPNGKIAKLTKDTEAKKLIWISTDKNKCAYLTTNLPNNRVIWVINKES